jgi:uncharacterized protein
MQESSELYTKANDLQWIQTYKGNKFRLDSPKFDIEEIAHALSLQCRFTGHIRDFYSVAEHSVMVAGLSKIFGGDPFEGLMHDAHEAYFSDLASPWKAVVPDYKKIEKRLEAAMRKQFGLPDEITETVKKADWVALFIEARRLLNGPLDDWIAPEGIREEADKLYKTIRPACLMPNAAKRFFLEAFESLVEKKNDAA